MILEKQRAEMLKIEACQRKEKNTLSVSGSARDDLEKGADS